MAFREKLAFLMRENRETKYWLAKCIGCSQSSVTNWLNGIQPQRGNITKLAEHYGITPKELEQEE